MSASQTGVTQEERIAALEQSVAELMAERAATAKMPKQSKKAKKAAAAEGESAEPKQKKEPTEWNLRYLQTVADMKQNGWESWTDLRGITWPASRVDPVKDKKGAETGEEHYVYDGGEHDGKAPSPALGGMVRASYLKSLTDPLAKAKAEKYHAKLAEKRSNASTGSGAREEPVADSPEAAAKKGGRPKMTEEQKAAAKLKRDAKKAAAAAPVVMVEAEAEAEEFEEVDDEAQTPTLAASPMVGGGGSAPAKATPAKKAAVVPKKVKKLDLNFRSWEHNGQSFFKNERGDVLDEDHSWFGRFNGTTIDETVAEPSDLGQTSILPDEE